VARDAPQEVIEAAFRVCIKKAHPDRGGDHQLALSLNEAREILCDPKTREEYDKSLAVAEHEAGKAITIRCPSCGRSNRLDVTGELVLSQFRCGACKSPFVQDYAEPARGRRTRASEATLSYCATAVGRCYHVPSCRYVRRMNRQYPRRWFNTPAEAESAVNDGGEPYKPCPTCILGEQS